MKEELLLKSALLVALEGGAWKEELLLKRALLVAELQTSV
jgi:hypothetical protein